ncbi:hypothetical protein J6590_041589 [Homalodisca vitripennis]|nr:hypothetical protein J6590_041589 [Homalodisca vitripennis]
MHFSRHFETRKFVHGKLKTAVEELAERNIECGRLFKKDSVNIKAYRTLTYVNISHPLPPPPSLDVSRDRILVPTSL